jgi:Helicase associated domain
MDERKKLLDAVDFVWDPCEFRWLVKYYELKDYTAKNGKGSLPGHRNRQYSKLSRWLTYQRCCYRKYLHGEISSMTERRKELLLELGFSEFGEAKEGRRI